MRYKAWSWLRWVVVFLGGYFVAISCGKVPASQGCRVWVKRGGEIAIVGNCPAAVRPMLDEAIDKALSRTDRVERKLRDQNRKDEVKK